MLDTDSPMALSDDMLQLSQQLAQHVKHWASDEGITPTAIPGLELLRIDGPMTCMGSSIYDPAICLIAQGEKVLWLGDRQMTYGPLSCLFTSVHLPVLAKVTQASPEQPYLGVKINIAPQEVADLVMTLGDELPPLSETLCPDAACGLCRTQADGPMVNAILRLVQLLDSPRDARILAPLVHREILYWALVGEMGERMRRFATADSQIHRVSKVITLLKDRFHEPLRMGDLAMMANMSESSLFHSFKQVTRMSPLQFQKKLRLHEARRLMLSEGIEASTASFRVGYESPSHFSRDYSRQFGAPPRTDVLRLRGGPLDQQTESLAG